MFGRRESRCLSCIILYPMDPLCLGSSLRTISVLVVHLLTLFCGGQSRLIGSSQPIVAKVGDDVILPCHLEPAVDVATKTLEWTRTDLNPRFVFVWFAGQDYESIKNPSYKGRTSLFTDELKRGNISLKLSNVKPADEGRYRCYIPDRNEESLIQLVVAAVSSPGITLAALDESSSGVALQCESKGWYPEPELLWLDSEGQVLSAGPTETVRGPDDLYTVSSRVTVDKRHGNRFTCRVQQTNINQTRETHIQVPDDFYTVQSSSSAPTVGLAVGLTLCIVLFLLLVFFLWRKKKSKSQSIRTKSNRNQRDKTDVENRDEDENDRLQLSEEKTQHEPSVNALNAKLETTKQQLNRDLTRTKHQLQEETKKRDTAEEELTTLNNQVEKLLSDKKNLEDEKNKLETDLKQKNTESKQLSEEKKTLDDKVKDMETRNTQLEKQLQEEKLNEKQREEVLNKELSEEKTKLQASVKELGDKNKQVNNLLGERNRLEAKVTELVKDLDIRNKQISEEKNQHEPSVKKLEEKTTKQQLEGIKPPSSDTERDTGSQPLTQDQSEMKD